MEDKRQKENIIEVGKKFIYTLRLQNKKWYIGDTSNLTKRLRDHITGNGSDWTKVNRVITIEELIEDGDEKAITLEYMQKYGWKNVRGYSWSQFDMKQPPRELRGNQIKKGEKISSPDKKENDKVDFDKNFTVFILKLEKDNWYVGKAETKRLTRTLKNHLNGNGSTWTKLHKVRYIENFYDNGDLKQITLDYMKKYGWQKVRGYAWSQRNMMKPPRELRQL